MPSPPSWLPPLNSHETYFVSVDMSQNETPPDTEPRSKKFQGPVFVINLQVDVVYTYPNNQLDYLEGLLIEKTLEINSNPKTLISSLTDDVLNADLVPFILNKVSWRVINHDDNDNDDIVEHLNEEEVYVKIFEFLCNLIKNPNNAKRDILYVRLRIVKCVYVPANEYWSWILFYKEKKLLCLLRDSTTGRVFHSMIANEYDNAISRPRTEVELFEEMLSLRMYKRASRESVDELESVIYDEDNNPQFCTKVTSGMSCSICLEGFVHGISLVTRLPKCLHVFHRGCVVRWLSRVNHVCPLCRDPLPTDDRYREYMIRRSQGFLIF